MSDEEQRPESDAKPTPEPDPGEPWAKTSSGDADDVTDEDT